MTRQAKFCGLSEENEELVGARGFEPPTPRSRTECSTRLSHAPTGDYQIGYVAISESAIVSINDPITKLLDDEVLRSQG